MKPEPFEFGITYVLNPNDDEVAIRRHLRHIRELGRNRIVILATLIGVLFFKEKLKWLQVAGLVLAIAAIALAF